MNVLIVDDEPLARRALRQLLAAHADVEVARECVDAIDAGAALGAQAFDLVLLDIRMPEVSGLSLAASLPAGPLIVFVTAHEEYGARAFDAGAADYLVKPVTPDRLARTLDRVRRRMATTRDAARYRELTKGGEDRHDYVDRLIVRVGQRDLVIQVDDIDLVVADDVYAAVHARGHRHLLRYSLDRLEGMLDPARFARVHRSYLVRLDAVLAVHRRADAGGPVLELRNGATVPVSRRRRKELARLTTVAARG